MRLPIESAVKIVKGQIGEIETVQEWANEMKYTSSKYFSRKFRNHFGERPKSILIKIRIDLFFELIEKKPKAGCYEIALELGLKDEVALNRFVKRHTGKPPTEWKNG